MHPRWWRRWTIDPRPGLVVGVTIPWCWRPLGHVVLGHWLAQCRWARSSSPLGLLVDDAIIAVEMMVRKMEEGHDKLRSTTFAYEITAIPMLTGFCDHAAGFLPIGMAKSMTGIHRHFACGR